MKREEILELIKSCVRPYLAFLLPTVIAIMALLFAFRFADREMAQLVLMFLLAEGSTILGFYFGERSQKPKQ